MKISVILDNSSKIRIFARSFLVVDRKGGPMVSRFASGNIVNLNDVCWHSNGILSATSPDSLIQIIHDS